MSDLRGGAPDAASSSTSAACLPALSEHQAANEQLLLAGVQRWEQSERHTKSFEGQINLARAYLNLYRSNDAQGHMRKAVEPRPGDPRFAAPSNSCGLENWYWPWTIPLPSAESFRLFSEATGIEWQSGATGEERRPAWMSRRLSR